MPVSTSKEPARIAGMFDAIARRYDLLNRVLSAGLDRRWRERAVRELHLTVNERVLDMCTGTADLAIEAATSAAGAAREVVGIDFAGEMLRIGQAPDAGKPPGVAHDLGLASSLALRGRKVFIGGHQ